MRRPRTTIAVVGAGIAGLAAAWELTGGADGPGPDTPAVVLLEADARVGGKLAGIPVDGRTVDVGPDSFLGRRPEAYDLCVEVGLGDRLVPIGASGAAVWSRGAARPLPAGLFLGVPTRLAPVARSGILSASGVARLAVDAVAPRPDRRGPLADRAIGPLVSRKLGHEVVDRLVEPLLGGIYAGTLADASAAAVLPALLGVAEGRSSLMRSLRRMEASSELRSGGDAPAFWALRGGLESLAARLAERLHERRVEVRMSSALRSLERTGDRWLLRGDGGEVAADGVVLAVPAGAAADLLAPHDAEAAGPLRQLEYASVAVVTLVYPAGALPDDLYGTGLLVPRGTPLPPPVAASLGASEGDRAMVTACSYLWSKWPHLAAPDGSRLVRASVGRFGDDRFAALDDDALVCRVAAELAGFLGVTAAARTWAVTRWQDALPQYRVHHLLRVGAAEAAAKRLGGMAVAGAAYRGVGIPACIATGRDAARDLMARLESAVI
ncbi:MAG: protoporphyrinogen oxidase [Acidimicrobiales bacterium]